MPLSDDDVREILRIIDESDLDELQIQTDGFWLHVRKGEAGARDAGKLRSEGKDYVVKDGDVMHFRFNV